MKRRSGAADPDEELARLIRRSRLLDPSLRRLWLRLFHHLKPADRARLREILLSEDAGAAAAFRPGEPSRQAMP